jgi:cytokinesis protein
MDIFGRKKGKSDYKTERLRQVSSSSADLNERSIPYDKLGPAGRAPVPISAPITNPTLTADGTEFNLYQQQRSRAERELAYAQARKNREEQKSQKELPASPSMSESSTLYDNPASTSTPRRSNPSTRTARSSATTAGRSPMVADFGSMPSPSSSGRPLSSATTRTESSRNSRYAPSVTSSDTHHARHLSSHFHLRTTQDDFDFPRPSDPAKIDALFDSMVERRGLRRELQNVNMSTDQKWQLVWSDEQKRYTEGQKSTTQSGDVIRTMDGEGSPLWFIKKFMDRSITHKQAQGLPVSLRSQDMQ